MISKFFSQLRKNKNKSRWKKNRKTHFRQNGSNFGNSPDSPSKSKKFRFFSKSENFENFSTKIENLRFSNLRLWYWKFVCICSKVHRNTLGLGKYSIIGGRHTTAAKISCNRPSGLSCDYSDILLRRQWKPAKISVICWFSKP